MYQWLTFAVWILCRLSHCWSLPSIRRVNLLLPRWNTKQLYINHSFCVDINYSFVNENGRLNWNKWNETLLDLSSAGSPLCMHSENIHSNSYENHRSAKKLKQYYNTITVLNVSTFCGNNISSMLFKNNNCWRSHCLFLRQNLYLNSTGYFW